MHTTIMQNIVASTILFLFQGSLVAQQQIKHEPPYSVTPESGAVCEMNGLYIDQLVQESRKSKDDLFIIARPGMGERYGLSWRRLGSARFFLTDGKAIPAGRVVVGIGERTTDMRGRLEFYLGGRLFLVTVPPRGKLTCLTCCPV
jgi:hypothetical protein